MQRSSKNSNQAKKGDSALRKNISMTRVI